MKTFKSLALIFAGVIIGVGISFSTDLYAASSKLLGSKVANVLSVKLDGEKIGDGGVIGGTTYVPLRVVANNLGAEVVRVDKNEVVLSTGPDPTDVNMDQINVEREKLISQIRQLNVDIKAAKEVIENKDDLLRSMETDQYMIDLMTKMKENGSKEYSEARLQQAQDNKANKEKLLADAENNIPLWEKELAELEAKLEVLQK